MINNNLKLTPLSVLDYYILKNTANSRHYNFLINKTIFLFLLFSLVFFSVVIIQFFKTLHFHNNFGFRMERKQHNKAAQQGIHNFSLQRSYLIKPMHHY